MYKSHYLDVDGIRTHYIERGEGKPIVLIHGGGAGADAIGNFGHLLPRYNGDEFRLIAVDMVGFGLSDIPDPADFDYGQDTRTRHMIGFIEKLGLGPVILVGNSMGGTAAAGVAIERPDLVSKAVFMGSALNVTAEKLERNKFMGETVLRFDGTADGVRRVIKGLTFAYDPPADIVEHRLEMALRPEALAAQRAIMGLVAERGIGFPLDQLARVQCPTFIIAGKNDKAISLELIVEQLGTIPQADGHIFANCGHWAMIEHPEEFVHITERFFRG